MALDQQLERKKWGTFGNGEPFPKFLWPRLFRNAYMHRWLPHNGIGNNGLIIGVVGEHPENQACAGIGRATHSLDDATVLGALNKVISGEPHQSMHYREPFADAYEATFGEGSREGKKVFVGGVNQQVDALVMALHEDTSQSSVAYFGERKPEDFVAPLQNMIQRVMERTGVQVVQL